ncbi:putative transcription factor NAM family [Helianthus annuus]|nr:putative transcription factor NAM family [Helianthus annuus]KAJ0618294.1 putative transcription factor NAM family [Helianthus annuus]KAJ0776756.1 putative transcription factor NAM family [Helianthus annuus]
MCPPSSCIPLPAENENWTNEAIFTSLFNFKRGKPLPENATSDVNPFQYKPSDLPADLWYLWSGVKKDAEFGFWQETEAPCETFSNSTIIGSRTTLQFYEGRASHSRKTGWMMQEYTITEKCDNDTKGMTPDSVLKQSSEMDSIFTGDYIELNDLIDPGSRSSSSANSSCLTMTSDEYFDSMALLQEIENDIKDSSVNFNLSAPLKSTEVFIRLATSVSLITDQDSKRSGQVTSKDCNISKNTSKEGKKERVSRAKRRKMKNYLCFLKLFF